MNKKILKPSKYYLKEFVIMGDLKTAPVKTERFGKHYEILVELGKDATGSFITSGDGFRWLRKNGFIEKR